MRIKDGQAGRSSGAPLTGVARERLLREFERLVGEWDQADGEGGHGGLALRLLCAVDGSLGVQDDKFREVRDFGHKSL